MNNNQLLALLLGVVLAGPLQASPTLPKNRCENSAALLFSPGFMLCKPLRFYRDSVIAPAGESTIIKFRDGGSFSGQILMPSSDGLPDSFDMRAYPQYALGLRGVDDLPAEIANAFRSSMGIVQSSPESGMGRVFEQGKFTVYAGANEDVVTAFIVDPGRKDLILLLQFHAIPVEAVKSILKGLR